MVSCISASVTQYLQRKIFSPFDSQVLHLAVLVIERLDDTIDSSSCDVIVMMKKIALGGLEEL